MENKKGNELFLGVIGVATLIVAIIGATFAYFSADVVGNDRNMAQAAVLTLGFKDVLGGIKTNLIPSDDDIAYYAATDEDWADTENEFTYDTGEDDEEGNPITVTRKGMGECIDDHGNEICGTYTFTIGNPSLTTSQTVEGKLTVVTNELTDLHFMILDEEGNTVVDKTEIGKPESGKTKEIELTELTQMLLPSSLDRNEDGTAKDGFDAKDPTTYTLNTTTVTDDNGTPDNEEDDVTTITGYNRRTYKMIIWIHETGEDQTDEHLGADGTTGGIFTASITFESGASRDTGVTGVIAAAQKSKVVEEEEVNP